jgi:hypothetical protein
MATLVTYINIFLNTYVSITYRGMEKEMVDSYKVNKKSDLKLIKSRLQSAKAHQQSLKKTIHQQNHVEETVHPTMGVPGPLGLLDPETSNIQLWPTFSVDNASGLVKPAEKMARSLHPGNRGTMASQGSNNEPTSYQPMYSNCIPAYYIPAQMSANQRPTGGYFVSMPTTFVQHPMQVKYFFTTLGCGG